MLNHKVAQLFTTICREANTPFSRRARESLEKGKVLDLLSMRIHPGNYDSPQSYFKDAVVSEFLRKYEDFSVEGLNPKQKARDTFFECEARNKLTNMKFRRIFHNYGQSVQEAHLANFLSEVKGIVRELLGPLPRELTDGKFGKGSTFTDTGRYITIPDKLSSRPSITKAARCFIPFWSETAWSRCLCSSYPNHSDPLTVLGNRFTSVSKTAETERGICIEPSLNVFWQLAASKQIRRNLMKYGYNIETAQGRHREMARIGSLTGRFATVDLKNASDLFSYWFVRCVTPDDWFELLCSLRAAYTEVDGKWHRLEKFSSMGNGFTFELMTVILTALCLRIADGKYALRGERTGFYPRHGIRYDVDGDISVFGDDIICPPDVATTLLKVLPLVGLEANEKKTFLTGPFRESCGGDFFDGVDVRAYNLRKDPFNEPASTIGLANAIRRLGRQHRSGVAGFSDYMRIWFRVLDAIPKQIRDLRGPEHLGDLVVHDDTSRWADPKNPHRRIRNGICEVRAWVPVPRRVKLAHWKDEVVLAAALYGVPSSGVTPRGDVAGYAQRWIAACY